MEIPILHVWPKEQSEALKIQYHLKNRIITTGSLDHIESIAGVDTAFDHATNTLNAAVCVYSYPHLIEQERVTASMPAVFPYVPGLHAFREGPVILRAFSQLRDKPDVIIFAAHGIAHPRRFGMASHLGLILDTPSVGCSRKLLTGRHEEIGLHKGEKTPLMIADKQVGIVYRSREKVKPIFISPGHKCGIEEAADLVIKCLIEYRVPEPLRAAHRLANHIKRNHKKPI